MEKIIVLAIIFAIVIVYLKSVNNELAMLSTICGGIILLYFAFSYLSQVFTAIDMMIELSGIDRETYKIIFKVTSIGYLFEFGADAVADFGLKSLADKLIFVGKIMIFSISLPIIYAIINLLTGVMQ